MFTKIFNLIYHNLSEEIEVQHEARLDRQRQRLNWEKAAFNYDPAEPYHSEMGAQIKTMSEECQFCKALKLLGECDGMCCKEKK